MEDGSKRSSACACVPNLFEPWRGVPPGFADVYKEHKKRIKSGVYGLQTRVEDLNSLEASVVASMNEGDQFGFVLFHGSAGSVAYTHTWRSSADISSSDLDKKSRDDSDPRFQFAEWREEANIRQFFILFNYLFVRSDEYRDHLLKPRFEFQKLRARLLNSAGTLHPPHSWLGPRAILDAMSPSGWPGVYVLGSFARSITFYSQQVRALNLAWSLHLAGVVNENSKIGVIGGGIAGITISAALAGKGCSVTLLDPNKPLPRQLLTRGRAPPARSGEQMPNELALDTDQDSR